MITKDQIIFAYDFDTTISVGGSLFLKDFSQNECHLPLSSGTPPTRQTDGSYSFNGTTQSLSFGTASARKFWGAITDGWPQYTFISKMYFTNATINSRIFCTRTAGTVRQFQYYHGTANNIELSCTTASGLAYLYESGNTLAGKTRIMIHSGKFTTGSPVWLFNLYDGITRSTSAVLGTGVPSAFDRTVIPRIGAATDGTQLWAGRMYYLAMLKTTILYDDVALLNSMLSDGKKPWCN